jgi:hypothetical protein
MIRPRKLLSLSGSHVLSSDSSAASAASAALHEELRNASVDGVRAMAKGIISDRGGTPTGALPSTTKPRPDQQQGEIDELAVEIPGERHPTPLDGPQQVARGL